MGLTERFKKEEEELKGLLNKHILSWPHDKDEEEDESESGEESQEEATES